MQVGDIFNCNENHIAFAINQEGFPDNSIIKEIVKKGFSEITDRTYYSMGSVITKTIENKTYYGLVCYSMRKGSQNKPEIMKNCLNQIDTMEDIAVVSSDSTDNIRKYQEQMQRCNRNLVLYKK